MERLDLIVGVLAILGFMMIICFCLLLAWRKDCLNELLHIQLNLNAMLNEWPEPHRSRISERARQNEERGYSIVSEQEDIRPRAPVGSFKWVTNSDTGNKIEPGIGE